MTLFTDIVNEYDLKKGIEEKFIKKQTNEQGLSIYNYTDPAMYTKGSWDNHAVRKCRGIVVGTDGEVLARPYEKFFNYGQEEAGELDLDAPVEVTDKLDGSMLSLWWNPITQLPQFSTRGSFNSDQSNAANKWLRENMEDVLNGDIESMLTEWTLILEWISPTNRVVLNYGNKEDASLLGAVHIETGRYIGPNDPILRNFWKGETTHTFQEYSTLREALQAPPRDNAEGVVVRYLDEPRMVKIKQDDYLKAHAYLTNCTPLQIWRKVGDGYILEDFLQEAPDEFVPLVTQYYTELVANMEDIRRRVNSEWDLLQQSLPEDHSRKQLADAARGNPHSPALFMLADGKDIEPYLLKKVKPSALP